MAIDQVLMSKEKFLDFYEYYKGTPAQMAGIELLYDQIRQSNPTLLANNSGWCELYRDQGTLVDDETPPWPITKTDMAEIMGCSTSSLPDSLMDDYARCCEVFKLNRINQAYFLGQCGHESAGLRYPVEIHDGSNYEGRCSDLGNCSPGDGVKHAGTGWIQVTGRYNHQRFADYMASIGRSDPKIMAVGKTYTSEKYPWSISGFWWYDNGMVAYCNDRPDVDRVGQRVNGRYLPNGYEDRRVYTNRAFNVLGI